MRAEKRSSKRDAGGFSEAAERANRRCEFARRAEAVTAFHAELSGTRLSAFTCQLLPSPPISPTLSLVLSLFPPLSLFFFHTCLSSPLPLPSQTHIHTCSVSFSTLDGVTTRLHHRHHHLLLPPLDHLFVFLFAVFRLSSPRLAAYLTSLGHVGNSSSLSPFVEVPEVPTFDPRLCRGSIR